MKWLRRFTAPLWLLAIGACAPKARPVIAEEKIVAHARPSLRPGQAMLRDTARDAIEKGASPLQVVAYGVGVPGDSIGAVVTIPAERCALLYARSGPSVTDIDLHAFGEDGSQFGADEAPDDLPTLLLCPEREVRVHVGARIAQGSGPVALGLLDVPPQAAEEVARAAGARNYLSLSRASREPWPGLEESIVDHRDNLGGQWLDQRRVAVPVDARVPTRITAEVPARACLDALALPGSEVADLRLTALDERGRIFARADPLGQRSSLLLCNAGAESTSTTLELRPHAGRGVALLALSTSSPNTDLSDLSQEFLRVELAPVSTPPQPATREAGRRLAPPTRIREVELAVGRLRSITYEDAGCLRLDFVPMAPLLGYSARAWNPNGDLVGEWQGKLQGALFICLDRGARLDMEATRRAGPLRIEERKQAEVPKQLVSHPLAASRLLGRAHRLGLIADAEDIGRVEVVEASRDRLYRTRLSVPTKRCQTFMAAGGSGVWGLELRLLNEDTGLEFDFARGRDSAHGVVCAGVGETLDVTVELRTTRGQGAALWATRMTVQN